MATGVYIVKKGDTLSAIAKAYGTTVKKLVKINKISNPDRIVVGQKIKLSSGSSSSTKKSSNKATITAFGIQTGTDRKVYATWNWSKSNTENYKVKWYYTTGNGVGFLGGEGTVDHKQYTFDPPENANLVYFYVKPISKKKKVNNKETSYWTAEWSTKVTHSFDLNAPKVPPTPSVSIDNNKLTAELSNLDVNGKTIEFQIVKNDKSVFKNGTATITKNSASYSCKVDAGGEYKVRCRSCKDKKYSGWSEYSNNVSTSPLAPSGIDKIIVGKDQSEYYVRLEWTKVRAAKSYDVEYTTNHDFFNSSDGTQTITGITNTFCIKTGLEIGQKYFFRIRAVGDSADKVSSWCHSKSITLGEPPAAPTTWSSTTTVIVGEPLNLYWVHNSSDGSSETFAEIETIIGGVKETHTIKNNKPDDEKDETKVFTIDTSEFLEGTTIEWRVRTSGITNELGDWSTQRTIDVYAQPTLDVSITDVNGDLIDTLTSFPLYISALPGPRTQAPIGYHLSVIANEAYETVDQIGNVKMVNAGDEVYSKYFDISNATLEVELTPSSIDLENNIEYTIKCLVSMNSGLSAESSYDFTVSWTDEEYTPNAEISIDEDTLAAHIRPYCVENTAKYYKVLYDSANNTYTATTDEIDEIEGEAVYDIITVTNSETGETEEVERQLFTDTEEIVYKGFNANGEETYFYMVESEETRLVEDITLSVYRREYDGSFLEIATGLDNTRNTYVTDPHPALDYARYRVVAISNITGAVSYYDIPGYLVGEKAVVIQWNEAWSNFETTNEDALEEPAWAGSMLKLPYNIDVSDKNDSDVALIEYAGRKRPVSYYGTQIGETATWSTVIPKDDKETLYALRRLRIWMGDVYVREPSGSGGWANIKVTFNQKHRDLTIPISIEVTRVEGGI